MFFELMTVPLVQKSRNRQTCHLELPLDRYSSGSDKSTSSSGTSRAKLIATQGAGFFLFLVFFFPISASHSPRV